MTKNKLRENSNILLYNRSKGVCKKLLTKMSVLPQARNTDSRNEKTKKDGIKSILFVCAITDIFAPSGCNYIQ